MKSEIVLAVCVPVWLARASGLVPKLAGLRLASTTSIVGFPAAPVGSATLILVEPAARERFVKVSAAV